MVKKLWSFATLNRVKLMLCLFLTFAYIGMPLSIPKLINSDILFLTGTPSFTKLTPTKSSGSGMIFTVNNMTFYCGLGVTQGQSSCEFIEQLINKRNLVTVKYFLMPTRIGTQYPLIYSLEQDGKKVIDARLMNEHLAISNRSAWRRYYVITIFFAFVTIFLIVVDWQKSKASSS